MVKVSTLNVGDFIRSPKRHTKIMKVIRIETNDAVVIQNQEKKKSKGRRNVGRYDGALRYPNDTLILNNPSQEVEKVVYG